jgi:hypothetical protein
MATHSFYKETLAESGEDWGFRSGPAIPKIGIMPAYSFSPRIIEAIQALQNEE